MPSYYEQKAIAEAVTNLHGSGYEISHSLDEHMNSVYSVKTIQGQVVYTSHNEYCIQAFALGLTLEKSRDAR